MPFSERTNETLAQLREDENFIFLGLAIDAKEGEIVTFSTLPLPKADILQNLQSTLDLVMEKENGE